MKKIYDKLTNLLNGELYFTAGEQEIKNSSENFKKNVGYFDLLFNQKRYSIFTLKFFI